MNILTVRLKIPYWKIGIKLIYNPVKAIFLFIFSQSFVALVSSFILLVTVCLFAGMAFESFNLFNIFAMKLDATFVKVNNYKSELIFIHIY